MLRSGFYLFFILLICDGDRLRGQTLGGSAVYNFLKLPGSTQLSALGSQPISVPGNDISMGAFNPALLRSSMHGQAAANFNFLPAGAKQLHWMMGASVPKIETMFAVGIQYLGYGQAPQTDAAGNVMGSFRAQDYAIQVSASRRYLERWHYGGTLKLIQSRYGQYASRGLALDVGVTYHDTAKLFQAGFLARNMGFQWRTYAGEGEDLPFDLSLGVTKRLLHAPIQFSLTAHSLHRFDLRYRDTTFNRDNYGRSGNQGFLDNLFRHFVFSVQAFPGDRIELTLGYNYLRRSELSITNAANGLAGFSMGAGVLLKKMQIRYARSQYQQAVAYNQLGLNIDLAAR